MARIAKKVRLTEKQRNTLMQIVMSRTYRPDQIERAKIILLSSGLKQDKQSCEELGFTKKYNIHQLVYYEIHLDVYEAITREKRIKNWNRQWKINLIEKDNPPWLDLSKGLS